MFTKRDTTKHEREIQMKDSQVVALIAGNIVAQVVGKNPRWLSHAAKNEGEASLVEYARVVAWKTFDSATSPNEPVRADHESWIDKIARRGDF
jgi:hypothetical protein